MSQLQICTSNISRFRGVGAFDITRKSGGDAGEPFAPSQRLLDQALAAREQVKRWRDGATDLFTGTVEDRRSMLERADELEARSWRSYVRAFVEEMRGSLRSKEKAWRKLLGAEGRIVLCCYCDGHMRCHRGLLVELIMRAARRFCRDVVWGGEIGARGEVVSMELPWERVMVIGPRAPSDASFEELFQKICEDASQVIAELPPTAIVVASNEDAPGLSRHVIAQASQQKLLLDVRAPAEDGAPAIMSNFDRGIAWNSPWQPWNEAIAKRFFEHCNDLEMRQFGLQ